MRFFWRALPLLIAFGFLYAAEFDARIRSLFWNLGALFAFFAVGYVAQLWKQVQDLRQDISILKARSQA